MSATINWEFRTHLHELRQHGMLSLLLYLILRSNRRLRCWPSIKTICKDTGYGTQAVTEAKKALLAMGAFYEVPYEKRMEEECDLPPRQSVYQLTGALQINGKIIHYLYLNPDETEAVHILITEILTIKMEGTTETHKDTTKEIKDSASADALPEEATDSTAIHNEKSEDKQAPNPDTIVPEIDTIAQSKDTPRNLDELTPEQRTLLQALSRRWKRLDTLVEQLGDGSIAMNGLRHYGLVEGKVVTRKAKRGLLHSYVAHRLTEAGKALKNPPKIKSKPVYGASERDALVTHLAFALDINPANALPEYGNYLRVAKILDTAMQANEFPAYVSYVRNLAANENGWTVTINSLVTNGRLSNYLQAKDNRVQVVATAESIQEPIILTEPYMQDAGDIING